MGKWIFLSYEISGQTPAYGGGTGFSARTDKSMEAGDSCNTQAWEMPNHLGTHVDAPRHFSQNGLSVEAYESGDWVFERPYVLDISPVAPGTLIEPDQVDFLKIPAETDLLFLLTGFWKRRGQTEYWKKGPGISPEMADAIREYLPFVRALGLDMISVSSLAHREAGRMAHRAFLCHEKPILLIEDVDYSGVIGNRCMSKVIVAPFRVSGTDGAPCTLFAKLEYSS